MSFVKEVGQVIQKQYANSNIGNLIIGKANLFEDVLGNISDRFLKDVLDINTCSKSVLFNFWGSVFRLSKEFLINDEKIILTDDEFRLILKLKIFSCLWDGNTQSLNEFLSLTFTDSWVFVINDYVMYLTLCIPANMKYNLKMVLSNCDVLPRPAGVGLKVLIVENTLTFAFTSYKQIYTLPNLTGFQKYVLPKAGKILTYK